MYKVKTRNWHGEGWVLRMLNKTCPLGVSNIWNDKFYLETRNPVKAWLVWAYFMILRIWSGGWTYIVRDGHELGSGYKSIY